MDDEGFLVLHEAHKMTPRELAEKLFYDTECQDAAEALKTLESLLSEALAEAERRGQRDCVEEGPCAAKLQDAYRNGYDGAEKDAFELIDFAVKKARAAAYEEAAKIAEKHGNCTDRGCFAGEEDCGNGVAKQIRLRAKELK